MRSGFSTASSSRALPAAFSLVTVVVLGSGGTGDAGKAGHCGVPVPLASVTSPVGLGPLSPCPGVRPGAVLRTHRGSCTAAFLFVGRDGYRYMSTAGHCLLVEPLPDGERVWAPGTGREAKDVEGNRIGESAYWMQDTNGPALDFGLVRLDPGVAASAQMCHWGGPTGINWDFPPAGNPVVLRQYGHGVGISLLTPARTFVANGMTNERWVVAFGTATFGDSGSPVISADGRAVGILHGAGGGVDVVGGESGTTFTSRLPPMLARAERALETTLSLEIARLVRR